MSGLEASLSLPMHRLGQWRLLSRVSGTPEPEPLVTNLVSYWSMDETSAGTQAVTRNDSHGENHLTDVNTVASATGKVGNAASINNAGNEVLTCASNPTLQIGDIDFAIAFWVRFSAVSLASDVMVMSKWETTGNQREWWLLLTTSNQLDFTVTSAGSGASSTAVWPGPVEADTWYFVVMFHDAESNTINIQVDNGEPVSTAHTGGIFAGSAALRIGRGVFGTGATTTLLDEVAFWKNYFPTVDERTWLYNNGNGRSYAEVAAYPN